MSDIYADGYADGYTGDAVVSVTTSGTSARDIITSALKRANRLAPGETLDNDLASFCLDALNEVVEEMNGLGDVLWREIRSTSDPLTVGVVTVSTTWPGLSPCVDIISATYNNGALDVPMALLTMQQYTEQIWNKALPGLPESLTYDGQDTAYLYRVPTGQRITLLTRQLASEFTDLDTKYTIPNGYRPWMGALLAEKVAPSVLGGVTPAIDKAARIARANMRAANVSPAVINGGPGRGRLSAFLNGW